MTRYLNKRQICKLLRKLNVEHNEADKYNDLKRMLFNEIPNYSGKKKFDNIKSYIKDEIIPQRIQNIADDLDIFNNYQPPQQLQQITPAALTITDNILHQVNDMNDFQADLSGTDAQTQEAYFLGLIQAFRTMKLQFGSKYLVLRIKYGDGQEVMRVINGSTLEHLKHLIDVLEGKASDTFEDFSDSDQAVMFGLLSPTSFSLEWFDYKQLQKAFGYFPYYNKIKDLDLSMFGIYHNDEEADYSDNCFILACIHSNLFTKQEIDFMRSMIHTRFIPRDDIKYIAEIMKIQIDTYYYNEKRKKIDKPVRFNKGQERVLRLLIRCGHGMIYHDELVPPNKYEVHNLNTLITKMIEHNELELIGDVTNAEKFMSFDYEFENLDYSSLILKQFKDENKPIGFKLAFASIYDESTNKFKFLSHHQTCSIHANQLFERFPDKTLIYLPNLQNLNAVFINNSDYKVKVSQYRNTIQQIKLYNFIKSNEKAIYLRSFRALTSINSTTDNVFEFTDLVKYVKTELMKQLNININDYSTLPKMSLSAAFKHGCFDGVYAFSGIVKAFAKRCIHGGLIKTLYDRCFEVDDVKCFDINSSYGTSMNTMQGIPKGMPKQFYKVIPSDACYAFIQLNISNIRNDKLGRYGFIQEGVNFVDSVLYDEIVKYVDCDIEIINGYYFYEGFNDKINSFARKLYDLRSIDLLNKLGKNMLSSLYGKSLQSAEQFRIKQVPRAELNEFIAENGNYIYQLTKNKKGNVFTAQLLKSINLNFNIPQFGVQVLSESRKRMNEIINYCNEQDINIYSIKTDSFVIDSDKVKTFEQKYKLGKELGEFKLEYEAKHVKYTSASCYRAELIDGSIRMRGNVI